MFNSRQRERDREQLAGARAEVQSWQARLASDISTLDPGDDPMSRQAMLDASERHNAAGALLSTASTQAELQVAQRIVVEGLTATRLVRQHLGLPLGPELPPSATATVSAPTSVTVEDEHHIAHPDYHPQQPHFFGGGSFDNATAPRSGRRHSRSAAPWSARRWSGTSSVTCSAPTAAPDPGTATATATATGAAASASATTAATTPSDRLACHTARRRSRAQHADNQTLSAF